MKITQYDFDTPEEATAFLDDIQLVNDSAVTAWIPKGEDKVVIVDDAEGHEDELESTT